MSEEVKKRNPRFVVLAIAVLGLVAYVGYRVYLSKKPFEWSGTVEARTIDVGSRVGGRIKEVLVHEGDEVAEGQPLVVFELGDLEAQKLAAEGALLQAQALLEKLEKGARPEEIEQAKARSMTANAALVESKTGARQEQIGAAEARLAAQESLVEKARLDQERVASLFRAGAVAQVEADNAALALRAAQATRDALKKQLDELKNGVRTEQLQQAEARALEADAVARLVRAGSRVEDIKAARGSVTSAQGRLEQIKVLITEATVRAPRKTRVESLDLRPGDLVMPNAKVATLLEEDQLYLRIYVPETQLGFVKIGSEVPISVDSFPKEHFKGTLEHLASVGEYSPRNLQTADERANQVFAARVGVKEGRDRLRAGMAAFIEVPRP
ncbi:MAG: HlyD family efflux transporter periplasmic adaptor subunit [Polyangiaceae bacterium]